MLNDLLAKNQSSDKLYVEDVFSTWLYSGTSAPQTITNSINLSGKGGLVWLKSRSGTVYSGYDKHILFDTARTNSVALSTNNTAADEPGWGNAFFRFQSSGFDFGTSTSTGDQQYLNKSGVSYASWTFRKAPKFFDVLTYTGDGSNGRQISHSLGVAPGMIIVKRTDTSGTEWLVYHQSVTASKVLVLNTTDSAYTSSNYFNTPTSTYFSVQAHSGLNASGGSYVAYLFAHDTTADGVIQCGSFVTDGSQNATVNLGWEPQFVIIKRSDGASSWLSLDTMRGWTYGGGTKYLLPNTSGAEGDYGATDVGQPTPTGFNAKAMGAANATYIYLAIRRGPMRVPTDATKVFNSVTRSTNGTATTVTANISPVDLVINGVRTSWGGGESNATFDRLRGTPILRTNSTSSELTNDAFYGFDVQQGYRLGPDTDGWGTNNTYYGTLNTVLWNFRRAPGFFDVVCYTGTGSARTVSHNLGVAPELMIFKSRNTASTNWAVCVPQNSTTYRYLTLQTSNVESSRTYGPGGSPNFEELSAAPTASVLNIASSAELNASGRTFVSYLFASCPGVSKVGSYTGTGTTLQINCGFTNGARFVLIKRTDSTGGWHVWDSARGIVAGNDPYLLLNSPSAEVTNTDYVDAYSAGFELSSTAPAALNASGGTYIYLAIA